LHEFEILITREPLIRTAYEISTVENKTYLFGDSSPKWTALNLHFVLKDDIWADHGLGHPATF
jgi:hypothetical protein